jgi:hypothetical protein
MLFNVISSFKKDIKSNGIDVMMVAPVATIIAKILDVNIFRDSRNTVIVTIVI